MKARHRSNSQGLGGAATVQLLEQARDGDRRALEALFERYLPLLRRWAKGRLPQWARRGTDTHDLVQEAMIQTLGKLDTFSATREGALQAYLRQAILNRIRDELRRAARRPTAEPVDEAVPDRGSSPLEQAIGAEMVERYDAGLQQLSPEERELLVARLEFGCSYEQVAEAVGRPTAEAARLAVRRALVHLAQVMQRDA
jgi:RNA polymerase sigma factor (sigma-70 family)